MRTSSSLVKLIVFMVVTSALTFVLAATIGSFSFGSSTHYSAAFSDVTGLLPGNEVRISGVKVGSIDSVALAGDGRTARVGFAMDQGYTVPRSAVLQLRYRNLVGERYMAITQGPGSADPLPSGSLVPLAQTRNALDLTVLFNGFKPLFQALDPGSVNKVAYEIVQTLQGEGGTVDDLVARTASLTRTLADRDAVIGRVITNLGTVLQTVDDRNARLNDLFTQLKTLSAGFAGDRQQIGQSLAGIDDLTTATTGLLTSVRGPLKRDIGQLNTLAGTLNDEKAVVNGVVSRLPGKLDRIIGTATYGSWFNFYLCGFNGRIVLPTGQVVTPQLVNTAARCQGDGVTVGAR